MSPIVNVRLVDPAVTSFPPLCVLACWRPPEVEWKTFLHEVEYPNGKCPISACRLNASYLDDRDPQLFGE